VRAAGTVARAAGRLLEQLRARGPVRAERKHGNELVTRADLRSEQLIREAIEAEFPSSGGQRGVVDRMGGRSLRWAGAGRRPP
jgi:fructose-1,6-bisphosphatase/inositol monophosphatase family enzyme